MRKKSKWRVVDDDKDHYSQGVNIQMVLAGPAETTRWDWRSMKGCSRACYRPPGEAGSEEVIGADGDANGDEGAAEDRKPIGIRSGVGIDVNAGSGINIGNRFVAGVAGAARFTVSNPGLARNLKQS